MSKAIPRLQLAQVCHLLLASTTFRTYCVERVESCFYGCTEFTFSFIMIANVFFAGKEICLFEGVNLHYLLMFHRIYATILEYQLVASLPPGL